MLKIRSLQSVEQPVAQYEQHHVAWLIYLWHLEDLYILVAVSLSICQGQKRRIQISVLLFLYGFPFLPSDVDRNWHNPLRLLSLPVYVEHSVLGSPGV